VGALAAPPKKTRRSVGRFRPDIGVKTIDFQGRAPQSVFRSPREESTLKTSSQNRRAASRRHSGGHFLDLRTLAFGALVDESYTLEEGLQRIQRAPTRRREVDHGKITPEYIEYLPRGGRGPPPPSLLRGNPAGVPTTGNPVELQASRGLLAGNDRQGLPCEGMGIPRTGQAGRSTRRSSGHAMSALFTAGQRRRCRIRAYSGTRRLTCDFLLDSTRRSSRVDRPLGSLLCSERFDGLDTRGREMRCPSLLRANRASRGACLRRVSAEAARHSAQNPARMATFSRYVRRYGPGPPAWQIGLNPPVPAGEPMVVSNRRPGGASTILTGRAGRGSLEADALFFRPGPSAPRKTSSPVAPHVARSRDSTRPQPRELFFEAVVEEAERSEPGSGFGSRAAGSKVLANATPLVWHLRADDPPRSLGGRPGREEMRGLSSDKGTRPWSWPSSRPPEGPRATSAFSRRWPAFDHRWGRV